MVPVMYISFGMTWTKTKISKKKKNDTYSLKRPVNRFELVWTSPLAPSTSCAVQAKINIGDKSRFLASKSVIRYNKMPIHSYFSSHLRRGWRWENSALIVHLWAQRGAADARCAKYWQLCSRGKISEMFWIRSGFQADETTRQTKPGVNFLPWNRLIFVISICHKRVFLLLHTNCSSPPDSYFVAHICRFWICSFYIGTFL